MEYTGPQYSPMVCTASTDPFNDDEPEENDTSPGSVVEVKANETEAEIRPHVLNGQTAFTFYSFVLGFAIPLFLILVFYVQVNDGNQVMGSML